jgi:hypothetical protein
MSKYIPKVGEEFEWSYLNSSCWSKANHVILVTDKEIVYEGNDGFLVVVSKKSDFRPIQTKSDVEREQLTSFFKDASNFSHSDEWLINKIQQAGFTIPKKIKRSEILYLLPCWTNEPQALTNEICELLGDLLEKDKGGAE